MFKHSTITEESSIEEIEKEIENLKKQKLFNRNYDQGCKIILNSVYGVEGFNKFPFYLRNVAESTTLQSQDLIKYMEKIFNLYFKDIWYKDKEAHAHLGIESVERIYHPVVNYLDTDSVFVVFDAVYEGIKFKDNKLDFTTFITELNKFRLNKFVFDSLTSYVKRFNGYDHKIDGSPAFKLVFEQICQSVIWLAKKKYIKDVIWKKGNSFKSLDKIETKGIETSQSSIPKYCRNKLKDIIKFILSNDFNQQKLIDILGSLREEFEITDVDNICKTERISNYYDFIINDKTSIDIGKNCKPHTKGAAVYNYMLYNTKYKNKYQLIQSGDRVKYYYTKHDEIETFSFLPGTYPIEIAKDIDYDLQFEKLILSPLNNILKSMNLTELDRNLILFPEIF